MELLYRTEHYIIDVENCIIHRANGSGSITFNFELMCCYDGNKKSMPKPIRFDGERNSVVYWASKRWNSWSLAEQNAVNSLFNTHFEHKLLKD